MDMLIIAACAAYGLVLHEFIISHIRDCIVQSETSFKCLIVFSNH